MDGGSTPRRPSPTHHEREADASPRPKPAAPPVAYDEQAIVDRVLAGDREAFRALVEREGPGVVRACHRVLADLHEAEDAAQEAFVTAYGALATWRRDGTFGAWLTRIAVGSRSAVPSAASPSRGSTPATRDRPSTSPGGVDPAAATLRAERDGAVRRALAGLDEPYRETVSLRFFGELSLNEIAEVTGRPLGTVKTHLHRGLVRLRTSLEGRAP